MTLTIRFSDGEIVKKEFETINKKGMSELTRFYRNLSKTCGVKCKITWTKN